ncbi:MAG TPA: flagellar hook protein FlgE [Bryobacteraceae bacterium]|nr:flagellar hook protein FlgE [Bryobacteraceae bacterium]HOQ44196.1 flagellar hook protein FlgE [Bryobacteraceae bacterium]HPU70514.1 flagellar hook protein FlgE [Bryobacteraceae bacterium]
MFASFSTALSALNAHVTAVDVVGNNLANLNTPGYKTSTVSFRDLVTQSLGAGLGETQVGFGTGRPFTTRQFTQGAIQSSTGLLDAAIQGDGFFILRDERGGTLYTRAGNFKVDGQGYLTTLTGERVQGWMEGPDGTVNPTGAITDIVVPVGTLQTPIATTNFSLDLNLNAAATVGTLDATFSTPMEVVDSLGATHVLTITFTKTAAGEWQYEVTIPSADLASPPDPPVPLATGTITFDSDGKLLTPDPSSPTVDINITGLADGASDMSLKWSLYHPNGAPRLTQFAQPSAVSANSQDGSTSASLIRVGLADGGKIVAQYSNGLQRIVGQVALASIRNSDTLIAAGNNNFQASAKTAMPAIGVPGTGGRGIILGGSLEASTVDIAREFTNLIVYQRGYQANSRVLTTADEMSQETINLKR